MALVIDTLDTVVSAASTSEVVELDVVMEHSVDATIDTGFRARAEPSGPLHFGEAPTLRLVGAAGTLAASGEVSRLEDGEVRIEARTRYAAGSHATTLARRVGQESTSFSRWADGWLAAEAEAALPNAGVRPLCVSVSRPAATLIAPRVAIGVEHFQPGQTVVWRDIDGVDHAREVVGRQAVGPSNSDDDFESDLVVLVLDSELPVSIPPALLPPADLAEAIPGVANGVPGLRTRQASEALPGRLVAVRDDRVVWRGDEPLVGGDSGGAGLLALRDGWMVTTLWTYGGGGSGPAIHSMLAEVQASLDEAGQGGLALPEPQIGHGRVRDFSWQQDDWSSWDPTQDARGSTVSVTGERSVRLYGNAWKAISVESRVISEGDALRFEVREFSEGEISGIGFTRQSLSSHVESQNSLGNHYLNLFGGRDPAGPALDQRSGVNLSDGQWHEVVLTLPPSLFGQAISRLVFVADADSGRTGDYEFRNVRWVTT